MSNKRKFDGMSEEDFLKNKARRKGTSIKNTSSRKKNRKKSVLKTILIILASIIVFVGLVLLLGFGIYKIITASAPDGHENTNDTFENSKGEEVSRETGEKGTKKYFTFLATATDAGGLLTDVIMVARFHYDEKEPSVSILQIPRDTYVKMSTNKLYFNSDGTLSSENFSSSTAKSAVKINEVYNRGKNLAHDTITALLKEVNGKSDSEIKTILAEKDYIFLDADFEKVKKYASSTDDAEKSQLEKNIRRDFGITYLQNLIYYDFGIPTDYHAQVNIDGFRGVVDAIGGVYLNVPQNMDYEDEYQDLSIHLKKGPQTLDGNKAEQFVRFRGYPGGDVQRLDAQKLFVDAFLDQLLELSTITKIKDIVKEIQKNLYTDISATNMIKFADRVLLMDVQEDVTIQTLPGVGEYIGAASFFIADRDAIIELVNQEFNVFDTALISEDFCIIASEDIYRPAVSHDPDDEESVDEESDVEDNDEEDGNEKDNNSENSNNSEDDDKSSAKENDEDNNNAEVSEESDTNPSDKEGENQKDKNTDEDADSNEPSDDNGENASSGNITESEDNPAEKPVNNEVQDENLELLENLTA